MEVLEICLTLVLSACPKAYAMLCLNSAKLLAFFFLTSFVRISNFQNF